MSEHITGQELKRAMKTLDRKLEYLRGKREAIREGRISEKPGQLDYMNGDIKAFEISLRLMGEKRVQIMNEQLQHEEEIAAKMIAHGQEVSPHRKQHIEQLRRNIDG